MDIDTYARQVATRLNRILDWEDEMAEARARVAPPPERRLTFAPCQDSELDFLAHNGKVITAKATRKNPGRFAAHIEVCRGCSIRDDCLEIATLYKETHGIWGGKLPHERRTH